MRGGKYTKKATPAHRLALVRVNRLIATIAAHRSGHQQLL